MGRIVFAAPSAYAYRTWDMVLRFTAPECSWCCAVNAGGQRGDLIGGLSAEGVVVVLVH